MWVDSMSPGRASHESQRFPRAGHWCSAGMPMGGDVAVVIGGDSAECMGMDMLAVALSVSSGPGVNGSGDDVRLS